MAVVGALMGLSDRLWSGPSQSIKYALFGVTPFGRMTVIQRYFLGYMSVKRKQVTKI